MPPLTSVATSNVEFVSVGSGGVLLDLDTGQVLSLNESAADIWRLYIEGKSRDEITSDFMRRYFLDEDGARADIDRALTIPAYSARDHGDNLRYEMTPDRRVLVATQEGPVLEMSSAGDQIRLLRPVEARTLEGYLCTIAPKAMTLAGTLVLHASAIQDTNGARAFLGESGAGKTTTARAYGSCGSRVLAEDVLEVHVVSGEPRVTPSVESSIRRWAATAGQRYAGNPGAEIPFLPALEERGPSVALTEVNFLDRIRRHGAAIVQVPLSRADTTAHLIANSFMASIDPPMCRIHLARVLSVTQSVSGFEVTVPGGIEALAHAAAMPIERPSRPHRS